MQQTPVAPKRIVFLEKHSAFRAGGRPLAVGLETALSQSRVAEPSGISKEIPCYIA